MLLVEAKTFAAFWHKDQKYGDGPYTDHLESVACCTFSYTKDPLCEIVAWLHDILEDTPCPIKSIEDSFGSTIANAVVAITEPKEGSRGHRHLMTYWKIRANPIALAVKLCDRLSNMQASLGVKHKRRLYITEYPIFKAALYNPTDSEKYQKLWSRLDKTYEASIERSSNG